MVARALFILHNCLYDAWAAYDRTAVGTVFGPYAFRSAELPLRLLRQGLEVITCRRLGIEPKGLKAFRHCSARLMDQAGVPLKVRQERLGHAPGSKVTMVHYIHSMSEDGRIAAAKMGELLTAAVQ